MNYIRLHILSSEIKYVETKGYTNFKMQMLSEILLLMQLYGTINCDMKSSKPAYARIVVQTCTRQVTNKVRFS